MPSTMFTLSADSYISQEDGGSDSNTGLSFGVQDTFAVRTLIRSDLSSLGKVTVTSATLTLKASGAGLGTPFAVTLNRLTQTAWVEGDATWDNYATGLAWLAAGGDFTTVHAGTGTAPASAITFDITCTNLVQDAIMRGGILNAILKSSAEAADTIATFRPRDYVTVGDRPVLTVNYLRTGRTRAASRGRYR